MCRRRGQPFFEFRQWKKGASFNMEAVKQQIEATQKKFHSQLRRSLAPYHPPTVVAAPDKRPGLNFIAGSEAV
jgi:hypothetical protein